jgi:solute:Na+ symporter, SSS family
MFSRCLTNVAVIPSRSTGFRQGPGYAALYALAINFTVSGVLSIVLNRISTARGADETAASDYHYVPEVRG